MKRKFTNEKETKSKKATLKNGKFKVLYIIHF